MPQAEIQLTGASGMRHNYAEHQLGNVLIDGNELAKNDGSRMGLKGCKTRLQ